MGKRIVVVGLLPRQVSVLRRHCGRLADLRFVNKDRRHPSSFPQGNLAIVVTTFLDHVTHHNVIRQFGRKSVHIHHGGVKGLMRLVGRLSEKGGREA